MVAISRTEDNRRKLIRITRRCDSADRKDHWQDVLVGSCLGLAIGRPASVGFMNLTDATAVVSYRTYYRKLKLSGIEFGM